MSDLVWSKTKAYIMKPGNRGWTVDEMKKRRAFRLGSFPSLGRLGSIN
jgi:hypothetical protein